MSWSWNFNTLATWWEEPTHLKRPWCWERLKMGGEGDDRGWDGWMASPMRWTWVWVGSVSWWCTGKSGVLQSTGWQKVRHDWATELKWKGFCLCGDRWHFFLLFDELFLWHIDMIFICIEEKACCKPWRGRVSINRYQSPRTCNIIIQRLGLPPYPAPNHR